MGVAQAVIDRHWRGEVRAGIRRSLCVEIQVDRESRGSSRRLERTDRNHNVTDRPVRVDGSGQRVQSGPALYALTRRREQIPQLIHLEVASARVERDA